MPPTALNCPCNVKGTGEAMQLIESARFFYWSISEKFERMTSSDLFKGQCGGLGSALTQLVGLLVIPVLLKLAGAGAGLKTFALVMWDVCQVIGEIHALLGVLAACGLGLVFILIYFWLIAAAIYWVWLLVKK